MSYKRNTVSVIIPVHNEGQSIAKVVSGLLELNCPYTQQALVDDVIVCNNGSTDNSVEQAQSAGAYVINESKLGYGYACLAGMSQLNRSDDLQPNLVVFVDGDHSVKASELPLLLEKLTNGDDLVIGNRVTCLQEKSALSIHQRAGNLLASRLIRLIWKQKINDLGPFRAIKYSSLIQLGMQDKRFGWTVEMQVKAIQAKMNYAEIPVTTMKRIGASKISGTVKGTIGAALGIFGKIGELYLKEAAFLESISKAKKQVNVGSYNSKIAK